MGIKELLKTMARNFFIITTMVNFAMYFLGTIYRPEMVLPNEVLLYPPLYGLFGTLPSLVLYSSKELSVKQLVIRKVFHLIFLEILLILLTFNGENLCMENMKMIFSLAGSVVVIYILVNLISWFSEKKDADMMTGNLQIYQKMQEKKHREDL